MTKGQVLLLLPTDDEGCLDNEESWEEGEDGGGEAVQVDGGGQAPGQGVTGHRVHHN